MDNIEHLIKMMEHPDRYSQEEWQDVLADKDCQNYYRLMCDTAAALNNQYSDQPDDSRRTDDAETENALHRFQQRYMLRSRRVTLWRQIAAVFLGLVLVSALTFATIAIVGHHRPIAKKEEVVKPMRSAATTKSTTVPNDTAKIQPQTTAGVKQFVNASVGNILNELAAYYGLKVEVRSEQAARVRLYFNWNQQYDAVQVVEQLNQFEHIHITLDGDVLVLEAAGGTDQ